MIAAPTTTPAGDWGRLLAPAAAAAVLLLGIGTSGQPIACAARPPQPTAPSPQPARSGTRATAPSPVLRRQLLILPAEVDVLAGGGLLSRLPRPPGAVEIGWLVGRVPAAWLSGGGGQAVTVTSEILVGRGGTLAIGPATRRLRLGGGADPAEAAGISADGGELTITGTTVTADDSGGTGSVTGSVTGSEAGLPWLAVGGGGRVDVRDSQLVGLAGGSAAGPRGAALYLGPGATGSVVRTTVTGAGTGLVLAGTRSVVLDAVTVRGSAGTGIVLRAEVGNTLTGVTSADNGADGVAIAGTPGRRITGLRTARNQRHGILAVGLRDLLLTDVRSTDDATALELDACQRCVVEDVGVDGGGSGVRVGAGSRLVEVDGGAVTGAGVGVWMAAAVSDVTVNNLAVVGAGDTGVLLCGVRPSLTGAAVTSMGMGVEVCEGAADVQIASSTVRVRETAGWAGGSAPTAAPAREAGSPPLAARCPPAGPIPAFPGASPGWQRCVDGAWL